MDLAVRRLDATMIWHCDLLVKDLPLAWARAENVRRADVYIRPARGDSWPLVFVDDVTLDVSRRSAHKTSILVVKTSDAGGCQEVMVSKGTWARTLLTFRSVDGH